MIYLYARYHGYEVDLAKQLSTITSTSQPSLLEAASQLYGKLKEAASEVTPLKSLLDDLPAITYALLDRSIGDFIVLSSIDKHYVPLATLSPDNIMWQQIAGDKLEPTKKLCSWLCDNMSAEMSRFSVVEDVPSVDRLSGSRWWNNSTLWPESSLGLGYASSIYGTSITAITTVGSQRRMHMVFPITGTHI